MTEADAPTSTTLRLQVAVDSDDLRTWADWHVDRNHDGVAAVLYSAADRVDIQSSDLTAADAALDLVEGIAGLHARAATARGDAQEARRWTNLIDSVNNTYPGRKS